MNIDYTIIKNTSIYFSMSVNTIVDVVVIYPTC